MSKSVRSPHFAATFAPRRCIETDRKERNINDPVINERISDKNNFLYMRNAISTLSICYSFFFASSPQVKIPVA